MPRARPVVALAVVAVVAACSGEPGDSPPVGEVSEATSTDAGCPATVEGLDVYDGQGTIDWEKVAASGRVFSFVKATQGNYDTQKTFAENWSGTKAAGVIRSPYHFFDGTIDGVTQANYFLSVVAAQGGLEDGDLAPMLDIECPTSSTESEAEASCEYSGDSGWVDSATLSQRVFDWLATVEAATGRKAVLYSYVSWFASVGLTDPRLAGYPLFIASYQSCKPSVPAPWTSATFWQYSGTGTVPGAAGEVDLDRFLGTAAELGGLLGTPDAGTADGSTDASREGDGAPADAATPADDASGERDAGLRADVAASTSGGCACRAAGPSSAPAPSPGWLVALAALVFARRARVVGRDEDLGARRMGGDGGVGGDAGARRLRVRPRSALRGR